MYGGKQTLYDALDVPRDASAAEIGRAYRRIMAEMQRETTPPDPRRAALVRQAWEVLSDPGKREAYDRSLRDGRFLGVEGGAAPRRRWGFLLAGIAAALGALYLLLHREAPPEQAVLMKSQEELRTAVSVAVGRLHVIEISGESTPTGVAVATEQGVMIAPCAAFKPEAQVVVRIPPRNIPASLLKADEESGLCRLAVHAGASWPLDKTASPPAPRQVVYLAQLNAKDEVSLTSTAVKAVDRGPRGTIVELAQATEGLPDGTPLLDLHGRVVAVAMQGRLTVLPAAIVEETPPPPIATPPAEPEAEPEPEPTPGQRRREALEKAFRPPPQEPEVQ